MTLVRRLVKLVAATFAFAVYVWFTAVRNAGRVKRRKVLRRRSRLRG
ncbi:MAG TPA: hypothetical protein VNT23_07885 [Gaiellaceae bacterium]|nr:hypothetical protein [Gaiellaceae bacterium]